MCPLTDKGKKILKSMRKTYGDKEAKRIFYAMIEEKKLTDVEGSTKKKKSRKKK